MVNNPRAIALHRNLGFGIEGTKRNAIFLLSGLVDEHIMAKLLKATYNSDRDRIDVNLSFTAWVSKRIQALTTRQ